jgi:hypothetical protein
VRSRSDSNAFALGALLVIGQLCVRHCMKLDDSQSSADYFRSVASLAERLAQNRIAVYEHKFNYMAFGSWEIVAGRRRRTLRFTYDGKDSYLSYCDSSIKPQSYTDLQHRSFASHEGGDPFALVAEVLEREFSV